MTYQFYIEDLYERTEVVEPRGWKDIESVLKRNWKTHGMFFNYTDGTLKLGFACDGITELESAYQAYGTEAYYLFEVNEIDDDGNATILFSGEIDFSTRIYDEDIWEAEVHSSSNQLLIKNRANIQAELNTQADFDNLGLNKINYHNNISSLASRLNKTLEASAISETLDSQQSIVDTPATYVYANIGLSQITVNELDKFKAIDTKTDNVEVDGNFLTLENDGDLQFDFDIDIDVTVTADSGSGTVSYSSQLILIWDRDLFLDNGIFNTSRQQVLSSDSIGAAAYPNNGTMSNVDTVTKYYAANGGTGFRLSLVITMANTVNTQFTADITINTLTLTVTDKKANLPTINRWYHLHDVVEKQLAFITGKSDFLYSELLGDQLRGYLFNGCLGNMYITNGYQVRQITDKTPKNSLKSLIDNINVMIPVGYGIEEIESDDYIGLYDIYWVNQSSIAATIRIYQDVSSYISAGNNITFKNSESLYGTYEVTFVSWSSGLGYTVIDFTINNDQWYDTVAGTNPADGSWHYDVYLVSGNSRTVQEKLRLEEWTHFYSDYELINLGIVDEFNEEPFNEAIYNEVEIGFNKYANDEDKPSTLEEFQTESVWALPIKKTENKLRLIMRWIGSIFLFQESRERIFTTKPTTSHKYDKDIFFCEKTEKKSYDAVVDFDVSGTIKFEAPIYENIIYGNTFFNILGADIAANNALYQIDSTVTVKRDIENDKYIVPVSSGPNSTDSNDTVYVEVFTLTGKDYKMEADENILTSSGLNNPAYFSNQRRTIKRFLIKWGRFIKSSIAYLVTNATRTIQNTYYDVNGDFTTEINSYDLDGDCVDIWGSVQENANISTDDLGAIKFKPNIITAKRYICDSDYEMIVDAHKNKLVYETMNYGYIKVTSPYNNKQITGWLMELKRNPLNKIATFRLIERFAGCGIGCMIIESTFIIG